jgi:hypothetical protein
MSANVIFPVPASLRRLLPSVSVMGLWHITLTMVMACLGRQYENKSCDIF